tara:strand:+ start:2722 stop:2931 length:210 start_codon:yes stop_codon:yes gene_type:complete
MAAPEKYQKMFGAARANKIYRRGLGAYYSAGSKPKMSAHGWAVARLKAHAKGKATVKKADADLFGKKKS